MRYLVLTLALLGAGCAASTPIVLPLVPDKPILPGVDSVHVQMAWELAAESFARDAAQGARLSEEAYRLAQLADSLLGPAPVAQKRDTVKALEAFNAGADALKECLIYAMLLANPVQNGSSDASDVQFWSEFW